VRNREFPDQAGKNDEGPGWKITMDQAGKITIDQAGKSGWSRPGKSRSTRRENRTVRLDKSLWICEYFRKGYPLDFDQKP